MKCTSLILVLALLIIVVSVNATDTCGNATFSNLGQGGDQDILIYTYNGSQQELIGQWNTSSPDVEIPCGDFNVVVKPSAQARFFNPVNLLTDTLDFVTTFGGALAILVFLIVLWLGRR